MYGDIIKEITSVRTYKAGYIVRTAIIDGKHHGCADYEIKWAETPSGDYIGDPKDAYQLCAKRGIAPEKRTETSNVCSIGFSSKDGKWYGWSHRAIYGFCVGSTVKKGDCGYDARTPEDMINSRAEFFDGISDQAAQEERESWSILPDRSGISREHQLVRHTSEGPDGELTDWVPDGVAVQVVKCGRGEWIAETLDDAKQMAVDFAAGCHELSKTIR